MNQSLTHGLFNFIYHFFDSLSFRCVIWPWCLHLAVSLTPILYFFIVYLLLCCPGCSWHQLRSCLLSRFFIAFPCYTSNTISVLISGYYVLLLNCSWYVLFIIFIFLFDYVCPLTSDMFALPVWYYLNVISAEHPHYTEEGDETVCTYVLLRGELNPKRITLECWLFFF